jgi:hypothetical protein
MVATPTNGTPLTVVMTATPCSLPGVFVGRVMSISSAGPGLFSSWSAKAELEDDRNIAIDHATIAVLKMNAPELAARYLDDDLPEPFERLLDCATAIAGSRDGPFFIARYRAALASLLTG